MNLHKAKPNTNRLNIYTASVARLLRVAGAHRAQFELRVERPYSSYVPRHAAPEDQT